MDLDKELEKSKRRELVLLTALYRLNHQAQDLYRALAGATPCECCLLVYKDKRLLRCRATSKLPEVNRRAPCPYWSCSLPHEDAQAIMAAAQKEIDEAEKEDDSID